MWTDFVTTQNELGGVKLFCETQGEQPLHLVRRPGQCNKLLANPTVEVTKSSTNENKAQQAIQRRKAN